MNFLIQFVISIALSLASSLMQQAFGSKEQRATGTRGSASLGGKIPQYFLMGTIAEAGKREYRGSWGEVDGVPNAYVTDVHSFGDLPISALVGMFVGGARVTLPTTGLVARGYPVPEYKSDGKDTSGASSMTARRPLPTAFSSTSSAAMPTGPGQAT